MTDYEALCNALKSLTDGVTHRLSNLANAAALLAMSMPDVNWVGFYITEGDRLILGPFQGKPACVEIPAGKGVCGTALAQKATVRVENVHEFPGHIACDSDSRSELVIPLRVYGAIYGVLDIDSPKIGRFTKNDQFWLEAYARRLEIALMHSR